MSSKHRISDTVNNFTRFAFLGYCQPYSIVEGQEIG